MIEIICLILFSMVSSNWVLVSISMLLSTLVGIMELNCSNFYSIDSLFYFSSMNMLLVSLSCFLCFLSLLCTPEEKSSQGYYFSIGTLGLLLVLAFSSSNLITFYLFFEASLIPTLILIIGWGYQPERLQAGTYMMLYTVGASLPLLLVILWHCYNISSSEFIMLHYFSPSIKGISVLLILTAFLVKLPIYSFHLWLPKAHVEAPLAGSMILAGILLKLGGYGIIQMSFCFNLVLGNLTFFIVSLSMWGGFLATMMCFRQVDVKSLVAYSSVGHMSIVASGILLDTSWGVLSAVITMVAHGFSSSAMFCLAYFSYKKSHTRGLVYMKGMLKVYPILSMFWFIFCCINMACPPTLNLMGEMMVIPPLFNFSMLMVICMGLMIFFSAGYNMYLYSSVNHGSFSSYFLGGIPMKSYMMIGLIIHGLPLLLVFKSSLFLICQLMIMLI